MIYLYLTLLFFLIFLFKEIRRNHILSASLLSLYSLSFISTIILDIFSAQNNIKFIPTLFLIIILFLWLAPFHSIRKYTYHPKNEEKRKKIIIVIRIMGIFSIFALTYFAFYALKLFLTFDLSTARGLINEESILPMGFISLFFISFSSIYYIYIYFFFLTIVEGYSKKDSLLMFLSSLTFPVMVLCYFGRDGVLYWVINFLIMYLYFSSSIPANIKKKINKTLFLIIGSFIFLFLVITVSRFQESPEGPLVSLVNYAGQQFQNFSNLFYLKGQGSSLFPTFDTLLQKMGLIPNVDPEGFTLLEKLLLGDNYNIFPFFVGSFVLKQGYFLTILISLFASFYMFKITHRYNRNTTAYDFLIIYSFFQIPMCGVFYYRQGVSYMDIGFLYMIIIFIYIKYKVVYSSSKDKNENISI